jgi:hypothetical protein
MSKILNLPIKNQRVYGTEHREANKQERNLIEGEEKLIKCMKIFRLLFLRVYDTFVYRAKIR